MGQTSQTPHRNFFRNPMVYKSHLLRYICSMEEDALLDKAPKNVNILSQEEYTPTPQALRLAYYLANPTKKFMSCRKFGVKFGIPLRQVETLMQDPRFLKFVSELVPAQSDVLIFKAYKRINREMEISPYVKGNKGVEAAKIVLQSKGHIKPNQTNILNADLNLESVLDTLIEARSRKVITHDNTTKPRRSIK